MWFNVLYFQTLSRFFLRIHFHFHFVSSRAFFYSFFGLSFMPPPYIYISTQTNAMHECIMFYVYSHSNFKSKTDFNNNRNSHTTYISNKPISLAWDENREREIEKQSEKKTSNQKFTTDALCALNNIRFASLSYLSY